MKHIETQSEWENKMVLKIMDFIKSELYVDLPFLNIAFSSLTLQENKQIHVFGNDGNTLYYQIDRVLDLFKKNTKFLERAFLHSVLHCIFMDLWTKGKRDTRLWNIACDICVEYTIDHMHKPSTERILTYVRIHIYKELEALDGITASVVYNYLFDKEEKEIEVLQKEFYTDDHRFWPKEEDARAQIESKENKKKWQKIVRQTTMNKKRGDENEEGESLLLKQVEINKSIRNYHDFLQSFSVLREEIHMDEDAFDLSYYTYGLRHYKNMPLIEPLESKEIKRIQTFVIVIDTSYSTNGTLVENFLKETYSILLESNSFFHQSHIRIIQCDDKVRDDKIVQTKQDMENVLHNFTLIGGGSTDFRPAFHYVNELIENKQLNNMSGLLYFTDGKGIYPKKRPNYKTAFIYLDNYEEDKVPSWAIRLRVDPNEFLIKEK